MTDDAPLLAVDGLTTDFSTGSGTVTAVKDVGFEIGSGEIMGLVGESGYGKSTTAKTIVQLLDATDGDIRYLKRDGSREKLDEMNKGDIASLREQLSIIFRDPQSSLNPRKTVGEIIGRPMELHDVASGEEKRERIADLLETVGLHPSNANQYPHEFSGGQQQRIGIARALATNPQFIVADEPTSALDVSLQSDILNLLIDLQEEMDLTMLFISHDLSVVRYICDRIAVMYLGEIAELGTVDEVFDPPYHPYTKALLSSIPEADPNAEDTGIRLTGEVPSPINPPSGCRFHTRCPHAIEGDCDADPGPKLTERGDGHRVACVLDESELPGRHVHDSGTSVQRGEADD